MDKEISGYDLQEGVEYIRRDGTKTPPLEIQHKAGWLFDSETTWFFDPQELEGNLVFEGREHPHDLVAFA